MKCSNQSYLEQAANLPHTNEVEYFYLSFDSKIPSHLATSFIIKIDSAGGAIHTAVCKGVDISFAFNFFMESGINYGLAKNRTRCL